MAAINKGESKVHLWEVAENGQTTNQPKNIDVPGNPDKIAWFPLTDSANQLEDHLLFMAQTQANANTEGENAFVAGISMLDMEEALNWDGVSAGSKPTVTNFPLGDVRRGGWSTYRPIKRGGDYIATPVNTKASDQSGKNGLGFVNAKTRSNMGVVEIPSVDGQDVVTKQVLYVPVHTDELRFEIESSLNSMVVQAAAAQSVEVNEQVTSDVTVLQEEVEILMICVGILFALNLVQIGCACRQEKNQKPRGAESVAMNNV